LAAGTGDAEKPLLEPHLSGPFATGARLDGCRAFRAGSVTVAAHLPSRDFELGLFPVDGFLEGQVQIVLEVVTALRPAAASLTPEKVLEDVIESVAEAASAESLRARALLGTCMAEHIVAFAFILIAQRLIGFIDFFKLFFRRLLLSFSHLKIGMVLAGHLPIGLFELVLGRASVDT
jgi:hypothetical protein